MIQRKQTLYLLAALAMLVACVLSVSMPALLVVVLAAGALVAAVTIFLYSKRKLQSVLCVGDIFLLVGWYILLAMEPTTAGGHLEWPAVLPALAVICLFLARKGIIADEKLVRSLDRIR